MLTFKVLHLWTVKVSLSCFKRVSSTTSLVCFHFVEWICSRSVAVVLELCKFLVFGTFFFAFVLLLFKFSLLLHFSGYNIFLFFQCFSPAFYLCIFVPLFQHQSCLQHLAVVRFSSVGHQMPVANAKAATATTVQSKRHSNIVSSLFWLIVESLMQY